MLDLPRWAHDRVSSRQRAKCSRPRTDVTLDALGRRTFKRSARAAGWPDATPNKLRHLHASLLIKEGRLDAREIAKRMGHSVEMLERGLSHAVVGRARRMD